MNKPMSDNDLKAEIRRLFPLTYDEMQRDMRGRGMRFANPRFSVLYKEVFAEKYGDADVELIESAVDSQRKLQHEHDINRIERKSFREHSRLINALEAQGEVIEEILKKYDFSKVTIKHKTNGEKAAGIIQLADCHFNELVRTQVNSYDFEVAAKRLKKYANKATAFLKAQGVKNVVVANTGDILNSDRRLDEFMNMATSRTSAMMLAAFLIEQFLLELNASFNVTYIQVSGNESRLKDEPGNTDLILSDNYDQAVYNILKRAMKTAKGITFQDGDLAERVINIMGQNVLLTHGEQIGQNTAIADVQKIKGKYAQYGIPISFVACGHIHCAHIHDHFARSSSLVGSNAYTDRALQLTTRAAQVVHVFYENGEHDSLLVDLQNVDGYPGYEIKNELAYYNAKSEKKLHSQTVIHEIVI